MAPLPEDFSYDHYSAVYNALSFGPLVTCVDASNGMMPRMEVHCVQDSRRREKHGQVRTRPEREVLVAAEIRN